MSRVTQCEVAGVRYRHQRMPYKKGRLSCQGCAAWDAMAVDMLPLCDQLPECEGGIWKRQQQPSKGSPIVPIRIPADLLAQLDRQVKRTKGATRSSVILAALDEKCNTPAVTANPACNTSRVSKVIP